MTHILYIFAALVVGFLVGRFRAVRFQNRGEVLVARTLRANFEAPDYHLMNHVTLRMNEGTTQVDHILVSRFGIFVIETKDYKGWIFGNPKHAQWTQVLFKQKFKFQNPVFQNLRHVRAVQSLIDFLPPEVVTSVVVFTGDAEFKTPMPTGVFTLSQMLAYLRQQKTEVMSHNRVAFCVGRLETHRLAISKRIDVEHVEMLHRRHGGEV